MGRPTSRLFRDIRVRPIYTDRFGSGRVEGRGHGFLPVHPEVQDAITKGWLKITLVIATIVILRYEGCQPRFERPRVRYPPDHKAKAKKAILEAGAKALRKNGFHGIGVDGLAAAAGVTSGAFYSNFSNKEELLKDVIETYLGNKFIDADASSLAERRTRLKDYLKMYISCQHRDDPAAGCVMPTLSADVSRSDCSVREAYRRSMKELIQRCPKLWQACQRTGKRKRGPWW